MAHANGSSSQQTLVPGQGPAPSASRYPYLHLWPLQDTFQQKMVYLPPNQRVKVGRQTNTKTVPGERNAYFDSKVLSRTHAEIWEQDGKVGAGSGGSSRQIFIKDLKSSNGTFINGTRLSQEGVESDQFEIKSEDILEFGIDIISEDTHSIVHHKVAARAYCVFNDDDAGRVAHELQAYHYDPRQPRIAAPPPQANPLGQMGPPVMSAGGKATGISFGHVLHKLQVELAKSKETGQELQGLATAMSDIQETLGEGLPPSQNGSAVQFIPPQFRNPSPEAQAALAGPHGPQAAAFIALQSQMSDIQSSLEGQIHKIQTLETQLRDQEGHGRELGALRELTEQASRDIEVLRVSQTADDSDAGDDDDARSVITVTGKPPAEPPVDTVAQLSADFAEAMQATRALQAQHTEALSAVKVLTERIGALESSIGERVSNAVGKVEEHWESWRVKFEDGWKRERESWDAERERLRGVVREWEEASRRAAEEDEERAMNSGLSGSGSDDEGPPDDAAEELEASELLAVGWKAEPVDADVAAAKIPLAGLAPRAKRRRRTAKASLAMRALRAAAGGETPKAAPAELGGDAARRDWRTAPARASKLSLQVEKESSESGRESADTLRGERRPIKATKQRPQQLIQVSGYMRSHLIQQPIPVVTVLVVAVVAGALYYRHKD